MAKKSPRKRKKARRVDKRLLAYSAAASAALAISSPAKAVVQYSGPQNIPLVFEWDPDPVLINIDGLGTPDVVFIAYGIQFSTNGTFFRYGYALAGSYADGNALLQMSSDTYYPWLRNVPASNWVDFNNGGWQHWDNYGFLQYCYTSVYPSGTYRYGSGPFFNKRGFIGINFDIGGDNWHNGWILYDGRNAVIKGWAWEDVEGAPIHAVPEPGTLCLLALGAAGLAALRRRNRKQTDD